MKRRNITALLAVIAVLFGLQIASPGGPEAPTLNCCQHEPLPPVRLPARDGSIVPFIDFELVGGEVPLEGDAITDQFEGVVFSTFTQDGQVGPPPVIAKVGWPMYAFSGPTRTNADCGVLEEQHEDMPAEGQAVGCYFLSTFTGGIPHDLLITYLEPVEGASGVILDIDTDEGWTIRALDAKQSQIFAISRSAGDPGTGGGVATPWSISVPGQAIHYLLIEHTGSDLDVGLAFDNFAVSSPCPPNLCPADSTGPEGIPDGVVSVLDFLKLLECWGACPCP